MDSDEKPAFEILGVDRSIKIWANGHVEGLEHLKDWPGTVVINRIPAIVAREMKVT